MPWSAVLYDIHGNAWVYENAAPHTFVRRRVEVRDLGDGIAAVTRGPTAGVRVVSEGAAELFGTEFAAGK